MGDKKVKAERDMYKAMANASSELFKIGQLLSYLDADENNRIAKELAEIRQKHQLGYTPPKADT